MNWGKVPRGIFWILLVPVLVYLTNAEQFALFYGVCASPPPALLDMEIHANPKLKSRAERGSIRSRNKKMLFLLHP